MAKRRRKRKRKGLFRKLLKAGALLALAPMIPAMVGLIAATLTTNPMAARALKKKLKKKKLKDIVKMFMEKVIKKKHFEGSLESSFDYEYAFEGEAFHFDGDHVQALDLLYESSMGQLESLERDDMDGEGDNFVQAIADIVKMIFGFFKGLKKKKDKGEDLTPAEHEAAEKSDVSEEKADEAVHKAQMQKAGMFSLDPKLLMILGGALVLFVLLKKK